MQRSIVSGIIWSTIDSAVGQALTLAIYIIMARLLSPQILGIVAAGALALDFCRAVLIESIATAVQARAQPTDEDYNASFWLIAGFSLVAMVLAFAMAIPFIHWAGVAGAALAVALASPVWIVFSFYAAARHLGVDFKTHFNRVYRFHVVVGLPLLAAALLFERFQPVQGMIQLAIVLACSLAAYYSLIALNKWIDFDEVKQLLRTVRPA